MPTSQVERAGQPFTVSASHGFLKSHFAPAFFFLPAERRRALQTVYGFFRLLDDAVDTAAGDPTPYLDAPAFGFRDQAPAALRPWKHDKQASDLISVMKTYGIPSFAMTDFIDRGVSVDLARHRFETPMDTESYCYGVAGTVGIACLPIFGAPVEEARDFAVRLGIAVQWVNTIRDVGIDARMNRIYIPEDHLEKFGCTDADILAGRNTDAFRSMMRHEAEVARSHQRRAMELLPRKWVRELRPALIMSGIYFDLLTKIERQDFPVFTKRIALNIVEKVASTWRTLRTNK